MKKKSPQDIELTETVRDISIYCRLKQDPAIPADINSTENPSQSFKKRKVNLLIRKFHLGSTEERNLNPSDYNMGEKIGQGAYGLVYSAQQNAIDRDVAIKLIRPELAGNDGIKKLFLSEAVVTGDLDHPNIVPIYDFGMDQKNRFFYTMKQIKGISWDKVIKEKSESENVDILLRVCDGMAFAHDKGVIHRDLKPQNIMIGKYGEVFVMDWGIAVSPTGKGKAEAMTEKTNVAGTPVYMAPEMADSKIGKVNHLTDIYLLGGILYQIETGLTPHSSGNLQDCLKKIAKNEIQPTKKKSELIDIALKAMATSPQNRYQSVYEFKRSIRDYQSHAESIALAKSAAENHKKAKKSRAYNDYLKSLFSYKNTLEIWPENKEALKAIQEVNLNYARCAFEKADYDLAIALLDVENDTHKELLEKALNASNSRKLRRKHVKLLKMGSTALAVLVLLILAIGFFMVKAEKDRAIIAEQEMRIAQKNEVVQRKKAEKENYYNAIALVSRKIENQLFGQSRNLLNKLPQDMRGWEWGRLMRRSKLDLVTFRGHTKAVEAVAFSPDEQNIATASQDNTIKIWDINTGQQIKTLGDFSGKIHDIRYDKDGRNISALNTDGVMVSWDVETGRIKQIEYSGTVDELYIFYSSDKQYFIKRTLENTALIQNKKENIPISLLKGHSDFICTAAFSPDNKKAVTGSSDKTAIIWDLASGNRISTLKGHTGSIQSVKFSPSGKYILTGSVDKTAKLWSVEFNRDHKLLKGHKSFVSCVVFSPDNKKLATTSYDAGVKIWNIFNQKEERTLSGHRKAVYSAKFSTDGRWLITGGADNMAIIWDVVANQVPTILRGHTHSILAVDFSPDNKYAATGSWDRTIKIWDTQTKQSVMTLTGHENAVTALAFSPDGKSIISGSKDRTARIWDLENKNVKNVLKGHSDSIYSVVFSPDGQSVATGSWDKTIRIWDSKHGQVLQTMKGHTSSVYSVVFSSHGRRVISAGWDKTARIWDTESGQELMELQGHLAPIYSLAISPNGMLVATGSRDRTAIIWESDKYR